MQLEALSRQFCVVCPDLLGHGQSDKPASPTFYEQAKQANALAALIDHLGCSRAHIVGYSSGAWLAVGLAKYLPERLASLVLGGWDVVNGLPKGPDGPLSFDAFMSYARQVAPELTAWVTLKAEPGLRGSFEALRQIEGAGDVVAKATVPTLLWAGRDDAYHEPMQIFASAAGLPFISAGGNHVRAMLQPCPEVIEGVRAFVERACGEPG